MNPIRSGAKLRSNTFDIWPHGTVLQPGQQLIVTQTNPTAAAACGGTSGAFDTSGIGVSGAGTTRKTTVLIQLGVADDGPAAARAFLPPVRRVIGLLRDRSFNI